MPPIVGRVALFPYHSEPEGWAFCDGRELSIGEHETLFELLRDTFGGNLDNYTFAVPKLEAPGECRYAISLTGVYRERFYEGVVGETMLWATPEHPQNLVECAGHTVRENEFPMLRYQLGARFGAEGKLPDLRGKAPAKCRYLMLGQGSMPQNPSLPEGLLGEILLLPCDSAAQGLRLCNGDELPKQQYAALAGKVGNRFGGDAQHFRLPDLRSAAPAKFNYYIRLQGMVLPNS